MLELKFKVVKAEDLNYELKMKLVMKMAVVLLNMSKVNLTWRFMTV